VVSGVAFVKVPTLKERRGRAVNHRPPEAVLGLELLAINLPKGLEMPIQQTPQIRGLGIARLTQGQRFETGQAHEASSYPNNQIPAGDTHSNRQTTSICLIDHVSRRSVAKLVYRLDGTILKSGWSCRKLAQMGPQEIGTEKARIHSVKSLTPFIEYVADKSAFFG